VSEPTWQEKVAAVIDDTVKLRVLAMEMAGYLDHPLRKRPGAPKKGKAAPAVPDDEEPAQPKQRAAPTNWVGRLGDYWRDNVGAVSYPMFGKTVEQLVNDHGEEKVRVAMERYIAEERKANRPLVLAWFVRDFMRWSRPIVAGPLVTDGWMSDELERATRP
jgi:hypothetical protein